jgi:hypothetical protein
MLSMRRALIIATPILALAVASAAASAQSIAPAAPCNTTCVAGEGPVGMESMSTMPGMGGAAIAPPATGGDSMPAIGSMAGHMTLTQKRPAQPGDADRAARIVSTLRDVLAKYQDYRVAEQDGYMPFHAQIPQKQYHFVNLANAAAAQRGFDPTRPTALLYAPAPDGYRLIGAMYTAPRRASLDELNARVPLSLAQWHQHTNFCKGPAGTPMSEYMGPGAKFGLHGSIVTADACAAAGGTFARVIYNWMVHVYPFESDPAQIWKVDM